MISVSDTIIDKIWQQANDAPDEQMPTLVSRLSDEQPLLMAYLISVGEELLNEEEQELLFFFGVLIWQIMAEGQDELAELNEETLDLAEQGNVALLESLGNSPGAIFKGELKKVLEGYEQPALLNFVVEVVSESVQDEIVQTPNFGPMILYLKTVIDGLNIADNPA